VPGSHPVTRLAVACVLLLAAATVLSFGVAAVGRRLATPAASAVFLSLVCAVLRLAGFRIGGRL
jgi:hypothetical protein